MRSWKIYLKVFYWNLKNRKGYLWQLKEENKWDYFMKIVKMAPKKIGETSFLVLISKNIEEISNEYKEKVIRFLNKK